MQANSSPTLPEPDPASASHSERVADYIAERIAEAGGSIAFAEFMHHALYAPGLGYYVAGATKLGPAGDFITAPEVSPVFGRIVARQCAEVLSQVEGGAILEYGAGSGRLAADILGALADLDALPEAYLILEVSADLQQRQSQYLRDCVPTLVDRVRWIDALPEAHRGVIIANEVLDALPVERFVRHDFGVMQQRVHLTDGHFAFREAPAPENLVQTVANIEKDLGTPLANGYTSEICVAVAPWIGGMAAALREGIVFLFDYGVSRREYYAPERFDGWLRCHFRHCAHNDPLTLVGIQDLTAWVDFTRVARAAAAQGLEVAGYAAQAQFLMAGGLEAEMQDFASLATERQLQLSQQIKTLTLPGEMGERFKCLALRKGRMAAPTAFSIADRTHTL